MTARHAGVLSRAIRRAFSAWRPSYDGWFAGVPVRINNLGFRDPREYPLEKPPGTFRILVLGDSVTFGHGSLYETTYPYLLEQRLKQWRPSVNWQVWNLGVPGYNTRQELALSRGGRRLPSSQTSSSSGSIPTISTATIRCPRRRSAAGCRAARSG